MTTMIKTSLQLQELRRSIYIKAKAEKSHRFWGLYVHICKKETLAEAYSLARNNNGSLGIDGVSFVDIEKSGLSDFLDELRSELQDDKVMYLLKLTLKAIGSQGVPQGGVIPPLLSNLYMNEVDCLLEKAKEVTREGKYTHLEYARFADDQVVLVDGHPKWDWLWTGINKRLREVLTGLQVEINEEKTKFLDLTRGESFSFLGFEFRRMKPLLGKWRANYQPLVSARNKVIDKVRTIFEHYNSQPLDWVAYFINPILCGWIQYF